MFAYIFFTQNEYLTKFLHVCLNIVSTHHRLNNVSTVAKERQSSYQQISTVRNVGLCAAP